MGGKPVQRRMAVDDVRGGHPHLTGGGFLRERERGRRSEPRLEGRPRGARRRRGAGRDFLDDEDEEVLGFWEDANSLEKILYERVLPEISSKSLRALSSSTFW